MPDLDRLSQREVESTQPSTLVPSTAKFLEQVNFHIFAQVLRLIGNSNSYIKRIATGNGEDVFDADQAITFGQIAPPESATRRIAAGAFYNCLSELMLRLMETFN